MEWKNEWMKVKKKREWKKGRCQPTPAPGPVRCAMTSASAAAASSSHCGIVNISTRSACYNQLKHHRPAITVGTQLQNHPVKKKPSKNPAKRGDDPTNPDVIQSNSFRWDQEETTEQASEQVEGVNRMTESLVEPIETWIKFSYV